MLVESSGRFAAAVQPGNDLALQVHHPALRVDPEAGERTKRSCTILHRRFFIIDAVTAGSMAIVRHGHDIDALGEVNLVACPY
jgi:hypothetical protein